MFYDYICTQLDSLDLDGKIRVIAELAHCDDTRLFARAHVWTIEGYKDTGDADAIDAIVLSAINYTRPGAKVGILRSAFSARRFLKYWHNLRDNAMQVCTAKEMRGLFGEVRNSTTLFREFTPRHIYVNGYPQDHFWPRPNWPFPKV